MRHVPDRVVRRLRKAVARWRLDPVLFARECLALEPWDLPIDLGTQLKVLRAAPRALSMAVRSGHKTGKSTSAAILALWAFVCFPGARVILTAPTGRQIREVLWREITRLYKRAARYGIPIGGTLHKTYSTGLEGPGERQVIGFTADNTEAFSGVSGEWVFYIVDEASGVDVDTYEAIDGNRAGGAFLWMFGNPTRNVGTFFDAFHKDRALYTLFHINTLYTPNVLARRRVIPGIATIDWVELMRRKWPPGVFAVRVEGNFPDRAAAAIIPLRLVEEAQQRWLNATLSDYVLEPLTLGVDVARFGDDLFAVAPRRGPFMYPLTTRGDLDGASGAGFVQAIARGLMRPAEGTVLGTRKPHANVDVIGVGASVYDHLCAVPWMTTAGVNVAERSDDEESFANLRTQTLFAMRDWLSDGGMLPPDEELASELTGIEYTFDKRGRIAAEEKANFKSRIGRSPDRGDAACLAVYDGGRWDELGQGRRVVGL